MFFSLKILILFASYISRVLDFLFEGHLRTPLILFPVRATINEFWL